MIRPPAKIQPPPGAPGWYQDWCRAVRVNAHHPESWPADDRRAYTTYALAVFRTRWRRLLADGDVALIRAQSGREYLLRMVRDELRRAMEGPPPRSPYTAACPCHPRTLGGMAKPEKGRERDPLAVVRP
jgi:hypothetical protein